MLFVGMQDPEGKVERRATKVQGLVERQLRSCPYADGSGEGSDEWVESRDLHDCNRVPCACRIAMETQLQRSSHTHLQRPKGLDIKAQIGGAVMRVRHAMTSWMGA